MEREECSVAIQTHLPDGPVQKEARRSFFRDCAVDRSLREKAFQAADTTLIDLYWEVGATISRKIEAAEWGDGVVEQLAEYIGRIEPGLHGFTRANLFRMRQFYETSLAMRKSHRWYDNCRDPEDSGFMGPARAASAALGFIDRPWPDAGGAGRPGHRRFHK
jgi:hypothetical protein